ncbi:MAG: flagellar hook-length control protein FliK, partial [Roseburia sp.]
PEVKVTTLVQMTKLGIPVNAANAAQFENYMADSHAIIKEMSAAVEQITSVFVNEEMTGEEAYAVNNRILDILSQEVPQAAAAVEKAVTPGKNAGQLGTVPSEKSAAGGPGAVPSERSAAGEPGAVLPEGSTAGESGAVLPEKNIVIPQAVLSEGESAQVQAGMAPVSENSTTPQGAVPPEIGTAAQLETELPEGAFAAERSAVVQSGTVTTERNAAGQPGAATEEKGIAVQRQPVVTGELLQLASRTAPLNGEPLSSLFTEEQLTHLTRALQSVPALAADETLFPNLASDETFVDTMTEQEQPVGFSQAVLNRELDAGTFLMAVRRALTENSHYGFSGVQKLFAGREYRAALENVMEQQWLLKPEELRQEKRVSQLYNRLDSQMQQMERLLRASGAEQQNFTAAATEVRSNIEFMNQVNQIYNYIQIPLKMSGQNASSELYVYTNRKSLQDPEGELTAFLHLDMENLGSTDVSIRLKNKNVHTDFYLEDDASYDLVEKHLPILEKHLKNKGYLCKVTVTRERTESANFVENVREKDKAATGTLHRYSFDVKA